MVFGDMLDCERPKIIATRYLPWQSCGIFMAPNGNIYVNPADYSENYALESKFMQGIFIHELTHVMQYQKAFMYYLKVLYYNQPIT